MKPYHNTLHLPDKEVRKANKRAFKQSAIIYEYLKARPNRRFTAWELCDYLANEGHQMLITSCRRSLSDLAKAHAIVHDTDNLVKERMGSRNSTYYYAGEAVQLKIEV